MSSIKGVQSDDFNEFVAKINAVNEAYKVFATQTHVTQTHQGSKTTYTAIIFHTGKKPEAQP
jgi:hypothetical protein